MIEIREVKREVLCDEIVDAIEQALLRGDLRPGERIKETEIAQKAGISRGPIREAIHQLVGEGILVNKPYVGAFVAEWSDREIEEIYSLRALLEGYATAMAAVRATPDDLEELQRLVHRIRASNAPGDTDTLLQLDFQFHDKLYALSDHKLLVQRLGEIRRRMKLLLVFDATISPGQCQVLANNHQAILDAVRTRDPQHVETMVREHVLQTGQKVVATLRQQKAEEQQNRRRQRTYDLVA